MNGTLQFSSSQGNFKIVFPQFHLCPQSKLDRLTTDKSCQELHRTRLKKGGTKRKCNFFLITNTESYTESFLKVTFVSQFLKINFYNKKTKSEMSLIN